jgi:hypothetical protein
MDSIQGGIGKVSGDNDHLAIAIQDAQTIVIQCRENDSLMAYSEQDLDNVRARIKLSQFEAIDGTNSSGLVMTFPIRPFSGTLYFRSTSPTVTSEIVVWSIQCGNGGLY